MKVIQYEGKIWSIKNKEYDPGLHEHVASKNVLVVLKNGKPPHEAVFGVPHQAKIGESLICENGSGGNKNRVSDENAASFALVSFSLLAEYDIPCKLVIAAHPTGDDPNKHVNSTYCAEVFQEAGHLLIECHGARASRSNDIEIACGNNKLTNPLELGKFLSDIFKLRYSLGIQKRPGDNEALIIRTDGTKEDGKLSLSGTGTDSLTEASENHNMQALHIEAKPKFRIPDDKSNTVTPDGLILGQALAQIVRNRSGIES